LDTLPEKPKQPAAEKAPGSARNIYVILNPVAGNSSVEEIRKLLESHCNTHSWGYEIYETTGEENIAEIASQACRDGANLVVAAGGDGTVAGVVNGLVKSDVPLGILPVGTGNGLARALSIPLNLPDAVALLAGGNRQMPLDAMQVGEKVYILNVSAGISSRAMRETPAEKKRRFGMLAYAWTFAQLLFGHQPRRFQLDIDHHQIEVRATEVLVSNGAALKERASLLGPRESFSDGQFEVYILTARTLAEYLRLVWQVIRKPEQRKADLRDLRVKESITIRSLGRPQPVQADGEMIGQTPVDVRILPRALQVIVPEET
jgi:YegS/Rv2252/BmrU family lipid kinase